MSNEVKIAQNPLISMIAVISHKTRAIGLKGDLLRKIEGDLPRFKKLTTGHPIIMGRKTYESIGRPLPNRTNIVITHNPDFRPEGVVVVSSVDEALKIAKEKDAFEILVIGGGEIYKQSFPFASRLYLTIVHDESEADTFFPDYSEFKKEIFREEHPEHDPPFTYLTLEK